MAVSNKAAAKIKRAVTNFFNFLKYRSVGPQSLTAKELKELIRNGYIDHKTGSMSNIATAYNEIHSQVVRKPLTAPKITRDKTMDFLERMFNRYADKAAVELENKILGTAEHNLMPFFNQEEGKVVYGALKELPNKKQSEIIKQIKDNIDNGAYRWKTIVATETNRAANFGALDGIVHNNKGKDPHDILVYKIGNNCNLACKHCCEFWLMPDGHTPKVYKLSELLANGSNIGKKVKDWGPTVDNTHPNCTHSLVELMPGFGFQNGKLEYISQDHNEYNKQKY